MPAGIPGGWRLLTSRGRGALAIGLVLLVAGVALRYVVVGGVGGVLVALVLLEWLSVARSPDLTVTRTLHPQVVVRNEACVATLHVHGSLRSGLVRTDAADLVDGALVPIALPADRGGAREAASTTYPIPTGRRGLHTVGPLQLRRQGLAGMAARSTESGSADQLRVLPRRVPLRALPAGHRRAISGGDDSVELGGTDLVDLHEYTMGDDLRRLHWATSARTGILMVREDADPSEPHVCVLLDDVADSYDRVADGSADCFEEAVELAAALCRVATAHGSPLRLRFTSARDEIVVPGSSRHERQEVREIDWLLAEIGLTTSRRTLPHPTQDLDIAVAVTGLDAAVPATLTALGSAPTRIVCTLQDTPGVASSRDGDALTLRAPDARTLACLWDEATR